MRIGVGLSIPELSTRGGRFSPASLFTSGVKGAWYDPSDYSSLFQDSVGTTAVTAVEQPVGLMLDKSQGLVLGSELVSNGNFASAASWSTGGVWVISGGAASITSSTASLSQSTLAAVAGTWYQVTFTISSFTAGGVRVEFGGANGISRTAAGTYTQFLLATSTSFLVISPVATSTLSVDDVSIKVIAGNHASQATSASRPVLRARYNLLTYSEQFDNAAWTSSSTSATISANTATAPDGTTTADSVTAVAGLNFHYSRRGAPDTLTGTYTYSIYVKKNTSTWIFFTVNDSGVNYFNLDTGAFGTTPDTCAVVALSNGWYRISATRTLAAAAANCGNGVANSNGGGSFTATGTESVYVWGAMLNPGSSAGTYQRIAATTDYATAGFLPYLAFDGSDDYLLIANTNDLNFGQGSFWAQTGLTSLGASQYDVIWGKNTSSNDNIRLFLISTDALGVFWGSDAQSYAGSSNNITKNTPQIQEWGINSSGPTAFYAVNGTESTPAITLSGTGSNSAPAYLGISNNLTQYQTQMNLYGMILRKGTLPTAAQRTESRNWMAAKSGAVL